MFSLFNKPLFVVVSCV